MFDHSLLKYVSINAQIWQRLKITAGLFSIIRLENVSLVSVAIRQAFKFKELFEGQHSSENNREMG